MERRTFLQCCSAAGLTLAYSAAAPGQPAHPNYVPPEIFPEMPRVKRLVAVPVPGDLPLDERLLMTCLQGLVNRTEPSIYLVGDETDRRWADYYQDRYGIPIEERADFEGLLETYLNAVTGYVAYDEDMLDSANVATVLSALNGTLPVSQRLKPRLEALGVNEADNLVGRWDNRYDAYRWALEELFPRCNQQLLGAVCTDRPHWPSESNWQQDYIVAHKMFTFDLSARARDREDFALFDQICAATSGPGCIMGWRCTRCPEHEFVALGARHDLSVLCCLETRNMTVHAAIPRPDTPYAQVHKSAADVGAVEDKVYLAFLNTDGDATWSMLRGHSDRLFDPEYGSLKYSWAILPTAWDLMPGVLRFLYEKKTDNDYFIAPSAGAMYTYPHQLPDPRAYLRLSKYYMDQTGLNVPYFTNWDDDFWWQEVELPSFVELAREEFPGAAGFVRGMGESAFEKDFIAGGAPYIYCGEGIHRDSDVYQTLADFVAANPIRPLFICCINNHSVPLARYTSALARFDFDYELVHLDEFMRLIQWAHGEGRIPGDDLYPDKKGLRRLLRLEAEAAWPDLRDGILSRAARAQRSEAEFRSQQDDPEVALLLARSSTPPADIVAFDATYDAMFLTRAALNRGGIYVNEKAKGVRDFMETFSDVEDAGLIRDLWQLWLHWQQTPVSYARAREYAVRMGDLTRQIEARLKAVVPASAREDDIRGDR